MASHISNTAFPSHIDRRKLILVRNFLFVFDLKFGGLVMAYFGMIVSGIPMIIMSFGILAVAGFFFAMLFFQRDQMGSVFLSNLGAFLTMVTFFFIGAPCALYCYFSYQLLRGVQTENSDLMVNYLIMEGVIVIFCILSMTVYMRALPSAIFKAYLFLCVYSCYVEMGGEPIF